MKLGILGGSFDPPHLGHLVLAESCAVALKLDRVLFIPAYNPPHKLDRGRTPFALRYKMVEAAIRDNPRFQADDFEASRGGISYTVETVRELITARPDDTFVLLMGADSLSDMPAWHEPEQIARMVRIGVYGRPGNFSPTPAWLSGRVDNVTGPLIDVSSTELRMLLARGAGVRYMIPEGVRALIESEQLYRAT